MSHVTLTHRVSLLFRTAGPASRRVPWLEESRSETRLLSLAQEALLREFHSPKEAIGIPSTRERSETEGKSPLPRINAPTGQMLSPLQVTRMERLN